MGFPRRYTKQETYKGLPIARDAERNTAIDTVALNSIKKMMDNGVGGKDDEAKLLRLDVAIDWRTIIGQQRYTRCRQCAHEGTSPQHAVQFVKWWKYFRETTCWRNAKLTDKIISYKILNR